METKETEKLEKEFFKKFVLKDSNILFMDANDLWEWINANYIPKAEHEQKIEQAIEEASFTGFNHRAMREFSAGEDPEGVVKKEQKELEELKQKYLLNEKNGKKKK